MIGGQGRRLRLKQGDQPARRDIGLAFLGDSFVVGAGDPSRKPRKAGTLPGEGGQGEPPEPGQRSV